MSLTQEPGLASKAANGLETFSAEPEDVLYEKRDYITTKIGNKISKKSVLCGSDKICVLGKTIIESKAVMRGDLAQVQIGKNCVIGHSVVLKPPDQLFKSGVVYIPLTIGNFCIVEQHATIQAASIGNCVHIGENAIVGKRCVIKDCCRILPNTVLAPGTVVPPFTIFGGAPGRFIGKLPNSYQHTWSNHVRQYYSHFKPAAKTKDDADGSKSPR